MRKSNIPFAVLLACTCATAAWGQQAPSGVQGYYGGGVQWEPYGGHDTTVVDLTPVGWNDPFTGSIPFALSASVTNGGGSASLAISATPSNGNIGLHGYGSAGFLGSQYEGSIAEAAFDLYAYDTFQIGGPSGAAEQFEFSLTLNGSAQASTDGDTNGTDANGGLQLFADSNWIDFGSVSPFVSCTFNGGSGGEADGNPCGRFASIDLVPGSPGSQTATGILTLIGGTTIQLGELLWARPYAGYAENASATFDASNTGYFTLTPITPGASFTTASGLSYAESPESVGSVPEPSTWALMLLGFGTIGAAMRRARKTDRLPQLA